MSFCWFIPIFDALKQRFVTPSSCYWTSDNYWQLTVQFGPQDMNHLHPLGQTRAINTWTEGETEERQSSDTLVQISLGRHIHTVVVVVQFKERCWQIVCCSISSHHCLFTTANLHKCGDINVAVSFMQHHTNVIYFMVLSQGWRLCHVSFPARLD